MIAIAPCGLGSENTEGDAGKRIRLLAQMAAAFR